MTAVASLGLRAAGVGLAVTAASLAVAELLPAGPQRVDRLLPLAVGLALAGLIFFIIGRRLARSLAEVIAVARAIGDGDFRRRLHLSPGAEFTALAEAVNHMARRIESHIATITDQKTQLEAILDGMREGVMVLDAAGRIRVANPALRRIVPVTGEVLGRRPIEAAPSPELQLACDRLLGDRTGESPPAAALEVELTPGRFYEVSLVRLAQGPADTRADHGAVLVFHDVSEMRRLSRVRRDFAANVTHEMRTPLTSIKGYAETLLSAAPELAPEKRRFLDVILKNANHMSKMVDDILTLARLEEQPEGAGGAKGQAGAAPTANAAAALAEAMRECEPLAEAKGLAFDNRLPGEELAVRCDTGQLTQVWRNLLENATRFAPEGTRIVLTASPDAGGETVTFGVLDQGPGIPPEERQRVFERFYRVERHRSKTPGSTGLGLAIVKHIVERHGGRVWVDRARGEMTGAAFHFTLNLTRRPQSEA
ncbi:MAG: HAMP domain-containing sensor histidine kinase [Solidesulfovibrio sp. DCME]|uniref:HAMP domain-containing sensor histidine kinase n=1 Tax=Solidesulfovibrio sp. DCME TaxID=3447380 RepID=UPI003D0CD315